MKSLKSLVRRLLHRSGYDFRALKYANIEETAISSLLRISAPSAVLDVGANVGQFSTLLRQLRFDGMIVSFEALEVAHIELQKKAARDSKWTIAPQAALGSAKGVIQINVSKNLVSSSLLPMRDIHVHAAPDSKYVSKQTVAVERLDHLATGLIPPLGSLYLKIDTQGYEKEVLKGSTHLLSRVNALQLELSIVPLYDGSPNLTEMILYARSLGFHLFNLIPGYKDLRNGRVLQLEGFFVRDSLLSST